MRRFLLSLAALAFGLALVGSVQATPTTAGDKLQSVTVGNKQVTFVTSNKEMLNPDGVQDYRQVATRGHFGYRFPGYCSSCWSYRCYQPSYGCYFYYCPRSYSYYPITYCPYGSYCG